MARAPVDLSSGLGAKLGPRLAQLLVQAQLATRRGLADTEHKLRVHSAQTVIDGIGAEWGQLARLSLDWLLDGQKLPPALAELVRHVRSGDQQWLAIGGQITGMTGAASSISTILSNYTAPAVRAAVSQNPQLGPDVGTLAQLQAHDVIDFATARDWGAGQGFSESWMSRLVEAAYAFPDTGSILDLVRRRVVGAEQAHGWMLRQGIHPQTISAVMALERQLLSPADAALALLRGVIGQGRAEEIARDNGLSVADLEILVGNTGEPPAADALLSLWRRGKIDQAVLDRGIRQSRIRDEWIGVIHELSVEPPSADEALQALVQGQTDPAEAHRRYLEAGGDPAWFEVAFGVRGEAPGPGQLGEMAHRGIIPWSGRGREAVTFEQGFHESRLKNKWLEPLRKLSTYLPPPRTITALIHDGAMDGPTASRYFQMAGMTHELAATYVDGASKAKVATHRNLAVGEVRTLYRDHALDTTQATEMLQGLGYDTQEAGFILATVDLERARVYTEAAITHVRSQYVAHHITRGEAQTALDGIGVVASQRDWLLDLWSLERQATVRLLTEAQVIKAHKHGLLTDQEAAARLVAMGYPQEDAVILITMG